MIQVRRRHVLYVPGFDPMPMRAHRERYRREAARQAELSGYRIDLAPLPGSPNPGWRVVAEIEGHRTTTDIEVLHWADLVRASVAGGVAAGYGALLRTAWAYIASGALLRLMRLRKGPVIAALYPVALLLLQGLAALSLAVGVAWSLALAAGHFGAGEPAGLVWILGGAVGGAVGLALLRHWARRDGLYAWYLIKDYAYSSSLNGAYPPEQERRITAFKDRLADVLAEDLDEVLVVGHSSGAHLAISVLADLLREGHALTAPPPRPILSLLTLGQVVPMVSFLPRATRLRDDLAYLSAQDMAWIDVTAPGDGCAFALCDPVAVSGVAPKDKRWPLVISAAFSQTLSASAQKALRWHLFERHFQYLNAFDALPDRADAYEYFRVTAGPMNLGERFATRAPSKSRIERAVNRYTDRAA